MPSYDDEYDQDYDDYDYQDEDDEERHPTVPTNYVKCFLPNRAFGLELETSKVRACPDGWRMHSDGSIDGMEYVMGPAIGKHGDLLVKAGCKALSNRGKCVDSQCGYHLHLDARDLSVGQIEKFLKFCYTYQDEVFSLVPQSRRSNSYCCRITDRVMNKTLEEILYDGYSNHEKERSKRDKWHNSRYMWINPHSYFYRGTLEVRLHSGTVDYTKVINWVELWLKLLEYSIKETEITGDIFAIMKKAGVRRKTILFYKKRKTVFDTKIVAWR